MLLLSNNQLESKGAEAFAAYFRTYDSVISLSVASTSMDSEGLELILESLERSVKSGTLSMLDISENLCTDENTVATLCKLLKMSRSLTSLNISGLSIERGRD